MERKANLRRKWDGVYRGDPCLTKTGLVFMGFQQCIEKNTSVFGGMVEKMTEKCYFCRAKHNSVNACARASADDKMGRRLFV